jgi:hypothetical protein
MFPIAFWRIYSFLFNVGSQFTDTAKFESVRHLAGISKNEWVQKLLEYELLVIDEVICWYADLLDARII